MSDQNDQTPQGGLGRRSFLTLGAAGLVAAALPRDAAAAHIDATLNPNRDRSLSLYNTHTGEHVNEVYWSRGSYLPDALKQFNHLLRDHRDGRVHAMDPRVLDLITAVQKKCEGSGAIHIISGYRSPATNAWLASNSDGVAFNSLHLQGKAIDIRLPGHSVRHVGRAARSLRGGGVGIYPASDFVHVDCGRVRYW